VGHVTKDLQSGPKVLEHVQDTVRYFEGISSRPSRRPRGEESIGAVSEPGVFEMTAAGLKPVANPSALFPAGG
jgi:DNA repair protein RadA/Sms